MIIRCPRCHRKNRLPDVPQRGGEYRCSQCGQTLSSGKAAWAMAQTRTWLRGAWGKKPPLPLILLQAAYLLALWTLAFFNAQGAEGWWLGSLNLYLPQWVWALPGGIILLLTLGFARRWAWVPLGALLWVFGPLMGLCWHWGLPAAPDAAPGSTAGTRLRVMTYNVKGGSRDAAAIVRDIQAFHPDLIQMQDSYGVMNGAVGQALAGWNVRADGQYLVASPGPFSELESRDLSFAGSQHHCVRYRLRVGSTDVTVYDVHLLSPREGLVSARHRRVGGLMENAGDRLQEAGRLAEYVQAEPGPTLLTGDLNAPTQSLVCRRLSEAGLRDAFSEAGYGYGYTYGGYTRVGSPYVRIDHIMASPVWRIERCWVGNAAGSDHCPVIADLVLPAAR